MSGTNLITYAEAARQLGKSARTIKRMVGEGKLGTIGRGPGRRIVSDSIQRHVLATMVAARSPAAFGARVVAERQREGLREFLAPFVKGEVDLQLQEIRERLARLESQLTSSTLRLTNAA